MVLCELEELFFENRGELRDRRFGEVARAGVVEVLRDRDFDLRRFTLCPPIAPAACHCAMSLEAASNEVTSSARRTDSRPSVPCTQMGHAQRRYEREVWGQDLRWRR